MTRQELYERVWSTPMSKLAPEFGVSDVALAKLCRRHAVPTPPRGYWMQLQAGRKPKRARLPARAGEQAIEMPGGVHTLRAQENNRVSTAARQPIAEIACTAMPATLAGCYPAVRRTVAFFTEIQKKVDDQERRDARPRRRDEEPELRFVARAPNGRHSCYVEGGIDVLASLIHVDWIGRFLQALMSALRAGGADLLPRSAADEACSRIAVDGHALPFSMTEGFERVLASKQDLSWWIAYDYLPLDRYKLKLPRKLRNDRIIEASRADFEGDVAGYAAKLIAAVREDKAAQEIMAREKADREARAAIRAEESRIWFAEQKRIGERRKARKAQAERALEVGKAQLRYEATLRVLADLEERFPAGDEGEGLRTWLAVAREGLLPPVDELLAELQREIAVDGGPDWWPDN